MGQFVKSDTSIDQLFSKFALDPEEAVNNKEKADEGKDKSKIKPDIKKK